MLQARALPDGVYLEGGAINGVAVGDEVLRTSESQRIRCGTQQIRRRVAGRSLELLHLVFAPRAARPLSLVRIRNTSRELQSVDYTEIWESPCWESRGEIGASVARLPAGERALAGVSIAVRARLPEAGPESGLA